MVDDGPLNPVPWHVELWVGIITRPLTVSVIVGGILAAIGMILSPLYWGFMNTVVFPERTVHIMQPNWVYFITVWFAGFVVTFLPLSKPY